MTPWDSNHGIVSEHEGVLLGPASSRAWRQYQVNQMSIGFHKNVFGFLVFSRVVQIGASSHTNDVVCRKRHPESPV